MELIEVEAVEDRSRPEGGYAVIVLRGATAPPKSARFRLEAVDADSVLEEARALLERDHEPLGVRVTEDGIALQIGPGLADSAFLVPGMPLTITLIESGLRGEFLWPAVTPVARPKRRNIMTRRTLADTPAVVVATLPAAQASATAISAPVPVTDPVIEEEVIPAVRSTALEVATSPTEQPVGVQTEQQNEAVPAFEKAARSIEAGSFPVAGTAVLEAALPGLPPVGLPAGREGEAGSAGQVVGHCAPNVEPVASEAQVVSAPPSPTPLPTPLVPKRPAAAVVPDKPAASEAGVNERSGKVGRAEPALPPAPSLPHSLPFSVAAARWTPAHVIALTVAGLLGIQFAGLRLLNLRVAKRVEVTAPAAMVPAIHPSSAGIYEVLATEALSPRGVIGDGVSPARALQLAHIHQHGPEAGRDREEAIYWLKRYVKSTAGTENTRIALTQLGTAYARPAGEGDAGPDMSRAIAAWELAAAMGDSVAMCFLATLYERGLGVAVDKAAAAVWAQRAGRGGSCTLAGTTTGAPGR